MVENSIDTKQKKEPETDQMSEVLWWFSTAIKELIQDCTVDRNRYKILGSAMLFTWLYATLAWGYFWSTNSDSPFLFVSLGIFMGGFVLSIDRVLVSSINKKRTNIVAIALRVIMALCIGAFLAQPIILFIFSSDIDREIPILLDKKLAEKKIWEVADIRKMGSHNRPSTTFAITSYRTLTDVFGKTHDLVLNEDLVLRKKAHCYYGDMYNHFVLAGKKNLLLFFPKK